jgi:hypothetical protein
MTPWSWTANAMSLDKPTTSSFSLVCLHMCCVRPMRGKVAREGVREGDAEGEGEKMERETQTQGEREGGGGTERERCESRRDIVRETDRERGRGWRERVCVCVCVCEREREREIAHDFRHNCKLAMERSSQLRSVPSKGAAIIFRLQEFASMHF